MREYKHQLQIRIPSELSMLLESASKKSKVSMNQIIIESVESRKKYIEKKYLNSVDSE